MCDGQGQVDIGDQTQQAKSGESRWESEQRVLGDGACSGQLRP